MRLFHSLRTQSLRQLGVQAAAAVALTATTGVIAWRLLLGAPEGIEQPVNTAPQAAAQMAAVQPGAVVPAVNWVDSDTFVEQNEVTLCQYGAPSESRVCGPAAVAGPRMLSGVDCPDCTKRGVEPRWKASRPIPFDTYGPGEYIGPQRFAHMPEYRLRVDDQVQFVYRLTREQTSTPYELNVGDEIRVESLTDEKLDRELIVQPDGTITVQLLGQVHAAQMTISELRDQLEERYKEYYNVPAIAVTPLKMNTKLEDLRATVDARQGAGGQFFTTRVTPAGNVQLPAIGSAPAQGLTVDELKEEVDAMYANVVSGIEVQPVLFQRAPRFIYVVGEVAAPGRYELQAPTTVMQSIALGGGWNNGGNLREVVVFRRGEDWRLMATRLDIRGALLGKRPCPADEIWLRDSDIVVVPQSAILRADNFIELVFTRGIYGVVPFQGITLNFAKAATL